MPRAPRETNGRTVSMGTGSSLRARRIMFTVRAMSGAVSASVPSRSKRTAESRSPTARPHDVVHVHVAAQRIHAGKRLVRHAGEVGDFEAGSAAMRCQLGRAQ